jgi:hypothetical protein
MTAKQVIDGVARANYHRGGLRCLRLLLVDGSWSIIQNARIEAYSG